MESSQKTHFLLFFRIALIPFSIELKITNYRNKTTAKKLNQLSYKGRHCIKQVLFLVAKLHSLSDEYIWGKFEHAMV